jgi:hypothetical protein
MIPRMIDTNCDLFFLDPVDSEKDNNPTKDELTKTL